MDIKVYEYTIPYIKTKTVLDIACGYGHGAYLMSQYAKSVTGIDIDKGCIKYARTRYSRENLQFKVMDIYEIPMNFLGKKIEVITAVEIIEHLQEYHRLLSLIYDLLKDNGILIISTPNRIWRGVNGSPWNPEHMQEFDVESFKEILSKEFEVVRILGITGSEKAKKYQAIRTGRKIPSSLKKLWRYTPETLKSVVRKYITTRLPENLTLHDYFITEEINSDCFTLIGICRKTHKPEINKGPHDMTENNSYKRHRS